MATKGKKSRASATPTPILGGGSTGRPASPLSPTRHSRLQEKAELQNLNDRLACYIDRVRNLENENARLSLEVQTTRETVTREVTGIKSTYEHELTDARKLLDETAREKAKLEIDTKRLWEENDELKAKLEKKLKDLAIAENSARVNESRCIDLTGKYNTACGDRKKAVDEAKDLEKENERLRKQLEELRKHLEDETLARVDLENNIQSLREELTFKDQIHSQELNETRTRRQVDISEIDGLLSEQYEAKLQQSLQELRDQYEGQMRANRDEIEMLYENKIKNLQSAANRNSNAASASIDELRSTRTRIDSLNLKIGELEAANATLNARIRDLEKTMEYERARHFDDIAALDAELSRLRDEMALQLQEYQDLMDIKVSLDLEIAAYDKLLQGEEYRLNMSTPSKIATVTQLSQSLRLSGQGGGGGKRKRLLEESEDHNISDFSITSSSKGDIEIFECDPEGRFVKLHNKSKKEIAIGGWKIVRTSGNNETAFKFHRSVKLDADAYTTVWSASLGIAHEPPTNIAMKQEKWFVGDNMKTQLFNADGEEVATSERVRRIVSRHATRQRDFGLKSGAKEMYSSQQIRSSSTVPSAVGQEAQGEEKCRIM